MPAKKTSFEAVIRRPFTKITNITDDESELSIPQLRALRWLFTDGNPSGWRGVFGFEGQYRTLEVLAIKRMVMFHMWNKDKKKFSRVRLTKLGEQIFRMKYALDLVEYGLMKYRGEV
jgi:hypothetical protein